MVRVLFISLVLAPAPLMALNEDQLRDLLAPAESSHTQRENREKVSDGLRVKNKKPTANSLRQADESKPANNSVIVKPSNNKSSTAADSSESAATNQASKYGNNNSQNAEPANAVEPAKPTTATPKKQAAGIYNPPARIQTTSSANTVVFNKKTNAYGIVIGTWIQAELKREVTSSDNAAVDVILLEDVQGRRRLLPAGTVLFGDKRFNAASERLEMVFSQGITPDGVEFSLQASLYDSRRLSGLTGTVVRMRDKEAYAAVQSGALTTVGGLVASSVGGAGGSAVSSGVQATSSELLSNERRHIKQPTSMIRVTPQKVLIRIDRTF